MYYRTVLFGAIATALLSVAPLAQAQLEEIIVTAQHKEQSLQDVPIAVTAIDADQLVKADIFDATTIAQNVPGLSYAEFAPGQSLFSMRGISSADDGAGLDNSVVLFLDGVYIGRVSVINFDMFDLDRIEVLRGPQGTLFGRNAIGGAINVISAKPSDETSLKAGLTLGNEGIFRYQAYATGPLGDLLSGKMTINHRQHSGYVTNVATNNELQDEDQTSFRGQLRWADSAFEWLLSADYMSDERADMGRTPIEAPTSAGSNNSVSAHLANGGDVRISTSPIDGFSSRSANGISLQGDIDFDRGTLTTITATRSAETDWEMASVGVGINAYAPGAPLDEVIDDIVESVDTFSQEFRWTSKLEEAYNYTVGLYFFTEDTERIEQFKTTKPGTYDGLILVDAGTQEIVGNEYAATFNKTTSFAVYAHGSYDFSDVLSLDLGGRYTNDNKDYRALSVNCGADLSGTDFANFEPCTDLTGSLGIINESFEVTPSDSWSNFSPKASLNYKPSDTALLYASISRGFKSGGFAGSQGVESFASTPLRPEEATNFEIGYKGDINDNFRFNSTLFYTDYTDLQIVRFGSVVDSDFGAFQTTNIGSATIAGLEAEFTWFLHDHLRLDGFYAHLSSDTNDLIINTTSGEVDASGSNLRQAPENSYQIGLTYDMTHSTGNFEFNTSLSHTDEQLNDYIDQRTRIDAFTLLDARAEWQSTDEKWTLRLWGKNLTGDDYISHSYVIGPGVIGVWGAPRTYGLSIVVDLHANKN